MGSGPGGDGRFLFFSAERIRCTPNGKIVIYGLGHPASGGAEVWISRDSGATWTLAHKFTATKLIDVGLSSDGSVMIATQGENVEVLISIDTGATWAAPAATPHGITLSLEPQTCNVSPDGRAFCIGYHTGYADLSFDQGATWTYSFAGSDLFFVASYVVPRTTPPTPPTPTPEGCVIADTDVFDYIFAFRDYGAFLRDTIVGPYARQTQDILVYNPVETVLHLPFFYPRTTPTVPIPPTVPPGVPDVITPPVPVVGNPTVDLPQLADSSLYLPTFWALIRVPGPVVAALWNHPNLVLVNDLTLMRASQCSVVKTRVDVSHINIMISNYGPVYVYDGLCVSPCVIQTMQ